MANGIRVAALADIPENGNRAFEVEGQEILIARTPLGVFAVGAICTHQYQKLEGGKMKACYIFCPMHGVRFDMRDGKPSGNLTDKPLPRWPVTVEDGDVYVGLESGNG
jgi:3-phenylpropionate/trans-cinnamate dioxygenase ferredoxin component